MLIKPHCDGPCSFFLKGTLLQREEQLRQLIQKEFWVVFSRIQLPIKLSRLAVCPRQGPADQPRTQASSRYPKSQSLYEESVVA